MIKHMTGKSNQRGINLLEVLVGISLFAIGMLALAQLQGSLARSSGDANARTMAMNIAEETLEAMRSFSQVEPDPAGVKLTFSDIVDNTETRRVGGVEYTIATEVTDYYYQPDTDDFDTPIPTGVDASDVDMKLVEMTVSWVTPGFDTGGESNTSLGTGEISLTEVISSITSVSGAKVALNATASKLYGPPVNYSPGQNPDIIAIELGDNKFKESTTPLPDVIRQDELTETKFDVVTYLQNNDGATFLRREEFLAVSCNCALQVPASAAEGGRRPTVWDGAEYTEGEFVSKVYGESANNQQSIYCDLCCRDHHDGGSGENDVGGDPGRSRVNPFRDSVDYFDDGALAGDHKHYNRDNSGNLILVSNDGANYVEACRMVRKDGFFRVAQDLRQEGLNSLPEDYLDQDSEIAEYSGYLTGAVAQFESDVGATNTYENNPPTLTAPENMVPSVTFPASGVANATSLPTALGGASQQLRSRGIYIDYFTDEMRAIATCLRLGGSGESCGVPGATTSLEVLPFYDVQLTWLSRWNETPTNNPVDVTNEAIEDGNTHSRGIAALGSGAGMSTVHTEVHFGNLGLTGTDPINPFYAYELRNYDLYVDANSSDEPPATGDLVSGTITSAVNGVKASDVEILATEAQCDRTSTGFECYIETGGGGPRLTVSNYGKVNKVLLACSEVLTAEARDTGLNAWTRFLLPTGTTTNADIVIRENTCG